MASPSDNNTEEDQKVPDEDETPVVKDIQAHYLRCPSPSFSMMSDRFSTISDRFSMVSGSDAESIFMEPIHLSSAIAAKKIINEELKPKDLKRASTPESMLESAEQLMVEDLYNRVKDMIDDRSLFNTPCVMDIQRALVQDRLEAPLNPVDEVWPNIFIGEKSVAVNKARLKRLGITHILNAGHGTGVYTGNNFYQGLNITYMGIEVDDFPDADISPHFRTCAEFLDEALLTHRGKVLVDSMMGVSRSAVLVAAYLMIFHNMSIMEALMEIRKKRAINPNEGFIKQLRQLNETLMEERDEDDDVDKMIQEWQKRNEKYQNEDWWEAQLLCEDGDNESLAEVGKSPGPQPDDLESVTSEDVQMLKDRIKRRPRRPPSDSVSTTSCSSYADLWKQRLKEIEEQAAARYRIKERDEDDDVDKMIQEWQKRNEKYQNEDWWEAQLLCEDGDNESLAEVGKSPGPQPDDLESVTSEDVQMLKDRIKRRPRRPPSDSVSTTSCSSYADLWKQRLKEIEEQAAARYRIKERDEDTCSEASQRKIDDDVDKMIQEWQKRNEKYQNEDWWEAQLLCEDGDNESLAEVGKSPGPQPDDLESVTSEDVQMLKDRIKRRPRRPPSDSVSTTSCSSYADLWKQRLKEIEEQAAARYRIKERDEDTCSEASQRKIDDDLESILSDSSSMYNFCQKNKENLTPLERWRIKRLQFGWNKKEAEADGKSGEQKEGEAETPVPSLEDVNITAYQTWKLKQQKKYGGEANKDEILEMSRGEDSATAKRRQRREELLERSRKTLEESQSVCGWETESSVSSIPLSAFCAGAFPSASVAGDDNMSVLSGRSSVLSGRSTRSQVPVPPAPPEPPVPVLGPNGEQMVNIANIQNWIANVVNETLMQKQAEMGMTGSLPPSRAGSVFSLGAGSAVGHGVDDDKSSVLSGSSYSSALPRYPNRAESVLSAGSRSASVLSAGVRANSVLSAGGASNLSSVSRLGSRRSKITTTSVPLYSLFQDQVNLHKLDTMEKEIKSDMREKMASYELKKITEDNKRSTLYKKKKQKDEDEDKEGDSSLGKSLGFNIDGPPEKPKPKRDFGRSGILNLPASANPDCSVDEWLQNVRPPSGKPSRFSDDTAEPRMSRPTYEEPQDIPEFDFSSRRSSIAAQEGDEEDYSFTSRYESYRDLSRDPSPEFSSQPRRMQLGAEASWNGASESSYYRTGRHLGRYETEEEDSYQEYTAKRKFTHSSRFEDSESTRTTRTSQNDEEDEEVSAFINQIRQRARARVAEELEDDEILSAWRKQKEDKSNNSNDS
uniref:Dual specificity phosphatase 27 n=1 Tax=Astyanax mexicanus TaxID=7994 RepID=A0A3B1IM67_ASTMX